MCITTISFEIRESHYEFSISEQKCVLVSLPSGNTSAGLLVKYEEKRLDSSVSIVYAARWKTRIPSVPHFRSANVLPVGIP